MSNLAREIRRFGAAFVIAWTIQLVLGLSLFGAELAIVPYAIESGSPPPQDFLVRIVATVAQVAPTSAIGAAVIVGIALPFAGIFERLAPQFRLLGYALAGAAAPVILQLPWTSRAIGAIALSIAAWATSYRPREQQNS